jgi:hypothetical protein
MGGGDQVIETRFLNRRTPLIERSNLGFTDIDAEDGVALTGNTACGGRADIAEAEYCNFHDRSPKTRPAGRASA